MEEEANLAQECHSQVLQQSLKDLKMRLKLLSTACRFPKIQEKRRQESFRFPQGCKVGTEQ